MRRRKMTLRARRMMLTEISRDHCCEEWKPSHSSTFHSQRRQSADYCHPHPHHLECQNQTTTTTKVTTMVIWW
jgi:hypothetical protein